jgi:ABC-2 type transport system permease protein
MTSLADKLFAILRRDLLTAVRHRAGFLMALAGVLTELAAFYYLARAVGPSFHPDGVEFFPFLLVGTGLYTFFVMSAQAFLSAIQEAQQTGTLEVMMSTSTPPAQLLLLSVISAFAGNLVNLAVYVLAGKAIFRAPVHANLLGCAVVLALSIVIALAFGITAATFQLVMQRGSALIWLLGSLWFLSGTMFPVNSLPRPLEILARAVPFTYAIDAMRGVLIEGLPLSAMGPTIVILAAFGFVLLPTALAGFSLSLRHARHSGTLSLY